MCTSTSSTNIYHECFFFQAEDGIRDRNVTGVQTCALPICKTNDDMKTAYELAMERLSKASPSAKLTNEQKKKLAELNSECKAKIADREIFLKGEDRKSVV